MAAKRSEPPSSQGPLAAGPWNQVREPAQRGFTGPAGSTVALRIACDREAFADVVGHAKESLQAEICGVLVGQIYRDEVGLWVEVTAAIRGAAANSGSSHVTFTQETWTKIHAERERRFPQAAIVGWYHSHPGFGTEFSEMDAFIHRNFFPGAGQIALVTDPVGGADAICINRSEGEGGVTYLDRIWIDGREKTLWTPSSSSAATVVSGGQTRIDALEARIGQLVGVLDDMRDRIWSFYLTVGMTVILLVMALVGWQWWSAYARRYEPPEVINQVSIPVRVGDRDVMMLARIYGWDVPAELNSLLLQQIALAKEAEAEARAKAEEESKNGQPQENP